LKFDIEDVGTETLDVSPHYMLCYVCCETDPLDVLCDGIGLLLCMM